MDVFIKSSILLVLLVTKVNSESVANDCERNERTDTRQITQFIEDQNKDNREAVKLDMSTFFDIMSQTVNSNMEKALSDVANSFHQKLTTVESMISELRSEADKAILFQQQLFNLLPIRTVVKKLSGTSGTIEFEEGTDLPLRCIWILQSGDGFYNSTRFVMEKNNLGASSHLTIWSTHGNLLAYNGSQSDWTTERSTRGDLIVVTFTKKITQPGVDHPSFKLRFNATRVENTHPVFSSQVMTNNGINLVSFPPNNAQNYPLLSNFQAVIAPSSGRPFTLTLKYVDVPGTRPACRENFFKVFFLEETSVGTNYRSLNTTEYKECGREGNISEIIGHAKVAILIFHPNKNTNITGTGFRVEVDTE